MALPNMGVQISTLLFQAGRIKGSATKADHKVSMIYVITHTYITTCRYDSREGQKQQYNAHRIQHALRHCKVLFLRSCDYVTVRVTVNHFWVVIIRSC